MKERVQDRQNSVARSFQSAFGKEELLAKIIEFFPYPIEVYAPDGTAVLVNRAMLAEYRSLEEAVVGKYNVLRDPAVAATGQLSMLLRAFAGESVFLADVKIPLEDIAARYGKDFDVEAVYQDITLFPVFNPAGAVAYVVALLINRRVYKGRDKITRAREYLETRWLDKFDVAAVAQAAGLSRSHFSKLFKKHTGVTPHDYYIDYKISRLKERLLDANLSVAEAFAACNLDYNGHFAKVFKERVGISPSEYRKTLR